MMFSPAELVNPKPRYYKITFTFEDESGIHTDHAFLRSTGGRDLLKRFWRFVHENVGLYNCYSVRIITVIFWLND